MIYMEPSQSAGVAKNIASLWVTFAKPQPRYISPKNSLKRMKQDPAGLIDRIVGSYISRLLPKDAIVAFSANERESKSSIQPHKLLSLVGTTACGADKFSEIRLPGSCDICNIADAYQAKYGGERFEEKNLSIIRYNGSMWSSHLLFLATELTGPSILKPI